MTFLSAVATHSFLQYAVMAGLLASVACGIVGTYVVVKRISYIAAAISHCVLGGMGIARYLAVTQGWEWLSPLHGAIVSALLAAVLLGWVSLRWKQREDTVISALWSVGMAVGILFVAKTPGYNQDLMSFLFGNILMVAKEDLMLIGVLDFIVISCCLIWYDQLMAICFDEEHARLQGVPVTFYYLLLLCLCALTVVLLVTVVGAVLAIALLTLPSGVAGTFARSLKAMMLYSIMACALFTTAGLGLSYEPDLPPGSVIVVIAGLAYLIAAGRRALFRRGGAS